MIYTQPDERTYTRMHAYLCGQMCIRMNINIHLYISKSLSQVCMCMRIRKSCPLHTFRTRPSTKPPHLTLNTLINARRTISNRVYITGGWVRACGTLCNPNAESWHFASPRACKRDDGGDDDYRDWLAISRQAIDTESSWTRVLDRNY